jgi:hypothetical protein
LAHSISERARVHGEDHGQRHGDLLKRGGETNEFGMPVD